MRCERNACRESAHWFVEQTDGRGGLWACEGHCVEALRTGADEVTDVDGEQMTLDDGEIARVA